MAVYMRAGGDVATSANSETPRCVNDGEGADPRAVSDRGVSDDPGVLVPWIRRQGRRGGGHHVLLISSAMPDRTSISALKPRTSIALDMSAARRVAMTGRG